LSQGDALIGERRLFDGWLSLVLLRARVGDRDVEWPFVEHVSGAAVLAYDPARRTGLVVRQTRLGPLWLGEPTLDEAVAGAVEDGDFESGARREMLEETGFRLSELEPVGQVWMTPSSTTERVHLFLAAYAPEDKVAEGGGLAEEGEQVTVAERPLAALWEEANAGMADAKLFMLLQALRLRRPELFGAAA
jgi:nudix-type nucleoside diphosphatase (YffH/AdpP family)